VSLSGLGSKEIAEKRNGGARVRVAKNDWLLGTILYTAREILTIEKKANFCWKGKGLAFGPNKKVKKTTR